MSSILHAAAIYAFLWGCFRVAGQRTLAEMTNFDLILILFISESAQNGMMGNDYSLTNSLLVIVTLIGINVGLSLLAQRSPRLDQFLNGVPLVIVADGQPLAEPIRKTRIPEADILATARQAMGVERMDQIRYAILERDGSISIIPRTPTHPESDVE